MAGALVRGLPDLSELVDLPDLSRLGDLPALSRLGDFLRSLLGLEYLELCLTAPAELESHYTHDQIFGSEDVSWPRLHTLSIHNIAMGTRDLISLFSDGLPSLRNLKISVMVLLSGRWEWIIQFMHEHMSLDDFQMRCETELLYPGGRFHDYQGNGNEWYSTQEYGWLMDSVRSYVLRRPGSKCPTIRGGFGESADELAWRYSEELRNFLKSNS